MADAQLVRIAELEIDPAQLPQYLVLLSEEVQASLSTEPGVLMLQAVQLRNEPHQIRLLEVCASKDAYEAHINSPHFLRYKAGTAGMVRALRLLDADPIVMRAGNLRAN